MNLQNHFSKKERLLQEHLKLWDKEILPHLPNDLDQLAKQTGTIQRKREIRSVRDLLKVFFLYSCSAFSFRILAVAAFALNISHITDTAWRKQFTKCGPLLHEILHRMLSGMIPPNRTPAGIKNVLLVDASIVLQQGQQQNQQRIHLCYHLNRNKISQIKVTDHHIAESLSHFVLEAGDLVIADAGYDSVQNYIYAREQQADVIIRITPAKFCLYDADGKRISLISILEGMEKDNKKSIDDVFGWCRYGNKTQFVRIVMKKLPKAQAEKARKRKRRIASKKQYHMKEETLLSAGYVVVMTSLGAEYDVEEIPAIYANRWQVELFFKRFKQSFSITTTKAGSTNYAHVLILLYLIIWVIAERQSFLCECYLIQKGESETELYSVYESCMIAFLRVKTILCLPWALVDLTANCYSRFLSLRKRHRPFLNHAFFTDFFPSLFLSFL